MSESLFRDLHQLVEAVSVLLMMLDGARNLDGVVVGVDRSARWPPSTRPRSAASTFAATRWPRRSSSTPGRSGHLSIRGRVAHVMPDAEDADINSLAEVYEGFGLCDPTPEDVLVTVLRTAIEKVADDDIAMA